jgi:hypothetical protein
MMARTSTDEAAIKTTSSAKADGKATSFVHDDVTRQGDVVNQYEFCASTIAREEGCAQRSF